MANLFAFGLILISSLASLPVQISSDMQPCPKDMMCKFHPYETVYEWKTVDFEWPSMAMREEMIMSKKYVPANNIITAVKVHGDRMFIAVPRLKMGVPATLAMLPYTKSMMKSMMMDNSGSMDMNMEKSMATSPPLIAYPDWEMNMIGDCGVMQNVQSMEIDQWGRMWVVDSGRINIYDEWAEENQKCPPKLIILNLATNQPWKVYEFPADVVHRQMGSLSDIAVGCWNAEECTAYISDSNGGDPRIVVYKLKENTSWFAKHPWMKKMDSDVMNMPVKGKMSPFTMNSNALALSQMDMGFSRLYFAPLSSSNLFSVWTKDLSPGGRNWMVSDNKDVPVMDGLTMGVELQEGAATNHGKKPSITDGMIVDSDGMLYFGLQMRNGVDSWNTYDLNLNWENQRLVVQNDWDFAWPDTISIDDDGSALVSTNNMWKFYMGEMDWSMTNFRILRFPIGTKSYMHSKTHAKGMSMM